MFIFILLVNGNWLRNGCGRVAAGYLFVLGLAQKLLLACALEVNYDLATRFV